MYQLDNVPCGIRSLLKKLNKTEKYSIQFSEKLFDELYHNQVKSIKEEVKSIIPEKEVKKLLENDFVEKIIIRVFKGRVQNNRVIGVRAYAQLEIPHVWFLPQKFERWTWNEDTGEFEKLFEIPTKVEFIHTMGWNEEELSSGEVEVEELFYYF